MSNLTASHTHPLWKDNLYVCSKRIQTLNSFSLTLVYHGLTLIYTISINRLLGIPEFKSPVHKVASLSKEFFKTWLQCLKSPLSGELIWYMMKLPQKEKNTARSADQQKCLHQKCFDHDSDAYFFLIFVCYSCIKASLN